MTEYDDNKRIRTLTRSAYDLEQGLIDEDTEVSASSAAVQGGITKERSEYFTRNKLGKEFSEKFPPLFIREEKHAKESAESFEDEHGGDDDDEDKTTPDDVKASAIGGGGEVTPDTASSQLSSTGIPSSTSTVCTSNQKNDGVNIDGTNPDSVVGGGGGAEPSEGAEAFSASNMSDSAPTKEADDSKLENGATSPSSSETVSSTSTTKPEKCNVKLTEGDGSTSTTPPSKDDDPTTSSKPSSSATGEHDKKEDSNVSSSSNNKADSSSSVEKDKKKEEKQEKRKQRRQDRREERREERKQERKDQRKEARKEERQNKREERRTERQEKREERKNNRREQEDGDADPEADEELAGAEEIYPEEGEDNCDEIESNGVDAEEDAKEDEGDDDTEDVTEGADAPEENDPVEDENEDSPDESKREERLNKTKEEVKKVAREELEWKRDEEREEREKRKGETGRSKGGKQVAEHEKMRQESSKKVAAPSPSSCSVSSESGRKSTAPTSYCVTDEHSRNSSPTQTARISDDEGGQDDEDCGKSRMSLAERMEKMQNAKANLLEGAQFAADTLVMAGETAAALSGIATNAKADLACAAVSVAGQSAAAQAKVAGTVVGAVGTAAGTAVKAAVKSASSNSSSSSSKKDIKSSNAVQVAVEETTEIEKTSRRERFGSRLDNNDNHIAVDRKEKVELDSPMKTNDTGVTKKNEVEQSKKKRSHQKKEEVNGSDQQKEEVSGSYPQDELVNESDQQNNNPSVCQNEQSSESNNFECNSNAEIFQDGKEAVKDDNKEVVIEGYKKNEEDGDQVLEVDDKNEKVEFKDGSKTAAEDNRKVERDGNEKFDGDGEKAPKKDGQNSEFDALESTKEKSLIQESHEESKEYKDESQDEGEIRNDNLEVKPTDEVDVEETPDKRFDEMKRNVESGSDHMKFEQPMSPSEKRQKLHNAQNKIFEGTKFAANTALSLGETAATIGGLAVDMQGKVAGAQATIAGAAAVAAGTVGTAIIKTAVKASSSSSSKDGKKLKETANIPTDTKEDTVETEPVKVVENKNDEVESEEITIDDIKIVTNDIINSIRSTKEVAIDDKCIEKSFSEQTEKLNIVKEKVEYLASNKEGTSSANMRKSDMRYEAMKFRATMDAIEYAETYMSDVKKSTGAEPVSLKTEFEPRKWMNPFTKKMYDKQAKWFKSDQNNKNQNESLNEVEEEPLENEMVEDAATDKFKKYQNPVRRHLTLPIASKLIEHQNKWSKNDA